MSIPGRDLSQPASRTDPSSRSAIITVSTESAMTSRETSEKCIPSCPIAMPSDTEIVPNSKGVPARREHPVLDGARQPVEGEVARGDLVPRAGDTDLRLGEVVVAHPDGPEHPRAAAPRDRP